MDMKNMTFKFQGGSPNLLEPRFKPFYSEISSLLQNVPSNALQETRRSTEARPGGYGNDVCMGSWPGTPWHLLKSAGGLISVPWCDPSQLIFNVSNHSWVER